MPWRAAVTRGTSRTQSQTITVTDSTAPTLVGVPADAAADCKSIPAPATVTATDDCRDRKSGVEGRQLRTDGNRAGNDKLKRTWSATDKWGNTTSQSQTMN